MPGKVKVKIMSGRNLPVMDRSSDTTDAYVEIKLGNTTYKTDVCRKSLHPTWNSEWYRFELDDAELQDEPLQIRLMDHDTYSANDAIGKVYIDLNPLLLPAANTQQKGNWNSETNSNRETSTNASMSGWFPVYDTMHGIRGEVNVTVKVELFSDSNKFRQSSCGVQFFFSKAIPHGYHVDVVHGFVEELVVEGDPEYQWIDKIRSPRASNEARQTLFFKLSGELQRKIGLKALDLGGNAVVGYSQSFDLEGESGIVARGIGTAVNLVKIVDQPLQSTGDTANDERSLNYLKFLGYNCSFRLNNNASSIQNLLSDRSLKKPRLIKQDSFDLHIELSAQRRRDQFTRHLSHTDFGTRALSEGHLQHSTSLQTLLKQEDNRGIPGHGISQRLKNFRYSSQSMLSKKMGALKAKLGDSGSIEGTATTTSLTELIDQKRKTPFKFKRTSSDSSIMAELLVRSVMQAQKSLDCIVEVHDSSPSPANQQDSNEQNSFTPILFEEKAKSESFLGLPQTSFDAHSSLESYTDSSSSEEDENLSDSADNSFPIETVSSIVKNVHLIERKLSLRQQPLMGEQKFDIPSDQKIEEELNAHTEIYDNLEPEIDNLASEYTENVEEAVEDASEQNATSSGILESNPCESTEDVEAVPKEVIPPFAQTDDFSIDNSDEEFQHKADFKITDESDIEDDLAEQAFTKTDIPDVTSVPTQEKEHDSKLFIPPVMIGANIKNRGLVNTAMQTMLLEKVNIMGTYSPPMSPSSIEKPVQAFFPLSEPIPSTSKSTTEESFFPHITKTFEKVRGSPTTISLSDITSSKDPILDAPFSSLRNIQIRQSPSGSYVTIAKKPYSAEQITACRFETPSRCGKSEERFPESPRSLQATPRVLKTRVAELSQSDDLQRTFSVDRLFKNKLKFLNRSNEKSAVQRRRSHEPTITVHKSREHMPEFLSHIFHRGHKASTKEKKSFKHNKGLLGAALKSVAMETVQDILATSHSEEKKKNKFLPFSMSAVLNSANTIMPQSPPQTSSAPANTEIDKGSKSNNNMHASLTPDNRNAGSPAQDPPKVEQGHQRTESVGTKMSYSPAKLNSVPCIHRRSSDSDLSITPKGNSLTGSDRSYGFGPTGACNMRSGAMVRSGVHQENFDLMEYPFLTLSKYPSGFIMYLGGIVSARSVKLLERISNIEEPESRDTWWSELRLEIRSHARTLSCNAVLAYSETTTICEDVCVLSASGTAAIIGYHYNEMGTSVVNVPPGSASKVTKETVHLPERSEVEKDKGQTKPSEPVSLSSNANKSYLESPEHESMANTLACSICHLPYKSLVPKRMVASKCRMCKQAKVPEVLITSTELPDEMPIVGRGCFLQAYVCRPMKELKGESNAKEISDALPFVEYEVHRVLISKLKIKGMNAIFGLKVRISIGEKLLVGIATGTAVFLAPLATPPIPLLVTDQSNDEEKLSKLQKHLSDTVKKNREIYQLTRTDDVQNGRVFSDPEDSEDEQTAIDLSHGNKEYCVLEVDDLEDKEVLSFLMETVPPDGFHVINMEFIPGLEGLEIVKNLQMFTQVWRGKVQMPYNLNKHLQRLLQSVYFKLRRMIPCALCNLQFIVDLPEPDEIQLCVLGMALGLSDSPKHLKNKKKNPTAKKNDDELIFSLEEDLVIDAGQPSPNQLQAQTSKYRPVSPQKKIYPHKQRHVGVLFTFLVKLSEMIQYSMIHDIKSLCPIYKDFQKCLAVIQSLQKPCCYIWNGKFNLQLKEGKLTKDAILHVITKIQKALNEASKRP